MLSMGLSKSFTKMLVILFLTSLVLLIPSIVKAQSKTLTVPDSYPTIQSAINHANAGDTVFVKQGLYNETLVIDKAISLIGENENSTIINAQKAHAQVILIESSNVVVANFTLGNSGFTSPKNSGWEQKNGEGDGLRIYRSPTGTYPYTYPYPQNITITNNTIIGCPLYGIDIGLSFYDNVSSNLIIGSGTGIQIGCLNSTIESNIFANLSTGIELNSEYLTLGEQTFDVNKSNMIQGNQNVALTTIPTPFPSISQSPAPYIFLVLNTIAISIIVIAILLVVIIALLLLRRKRRGPCNRQSKLLLGKRWNFLINHYSTSKFGYHESLA